MVTFIILRIRIIKARGCKQRFESDITYIHHKVPTRDVPGGVEPEL